MRRRECAVTPGRDTNDAVDDGASKTLQTPPGAAAAELQCQLGGTGASPSPYATLGPVPDLDNRRFCRACETTLPLEAFPPGTRRYLCRRHAWLRVKKPSKERARRPSPTHSGGSSTGSGSAAGTTRGRSSDTPAWRCCRVISQRCCRGWILRVLGRVGAAEGETESFAGALWTKRIQRREGPPLPSHSCPRTPRSPCRARTSCLSAWTCAGTCCVRTGRAARSGTGRSSGSSSESQKEC